MSRCVVLHVASCQVVSGAHGFRSASKLQITMAHVAVLEEISKQEVTCHVTGVGLFPHSCGYGGSALRFPFLNPLQSFHARARSFVPINNPSPAPQSVPLH